MSIRNINVRKFGTALISTVLNDLANKNESTFWSEHHICNELSTNWHRKFGFVEVTDMMTLNYRRSYYKREIYRLKYFGIIEDIPQLEANLKEVECEIERIEKLEKDDYRKAWGNWKYDF